MKNKVILIFPKIESNYTTYPLACLYLSGFLLKNGFEPVIFDHNEENDYESFLKNNAKDALCVGISAITGSQVKYGLRIAEYVKRNFPDLLLVWGGRHVTSLPEQSLKDERVDIVVRGEGELPFLSLVQALRDNRDISNVKGISYIHNSKIVHNQDAEVLDLLTMPDIPWHLIDMEKKMRHVSGRTLSLQTGRGCPFSCTYCSHKKFEVEKYRPFSAEYILNNIEPLIRRYNIEQVNFYEPHFISMPEQVRKRCEGILDRKLNIKWEASARANTFIKFKPQILKLMRQSGCERIGFGFESGSKRILEKIDKRIEPWQIIESVKLCKQYDIVPEACFMTGFPFETWKDTLKTMLMIGKVRQACPKIIIHIQGYVPFPNTILYEQCRQDYNLKEPQDMQWWGNYNNIKNNNSWLRPWTKKIIRLLSASIFISDFDYLKTRKDMPLKWLPHQIVKLFYRCLGVLNILN